MLRQGKRQKFIASEIGKDKSVVSREIRRNGKNGRYNWKYAQEQAEIRKERLRRKRKFTSEVSNRIERYMRKWQWFPEQIAGYCKLKGYAMVSVERIYQYVRKDKREGGDLYRCCRHALKHRRRAVGGGKVSIKDRVSIDLRPPEADGTRLGDWEMDLIVGAGNKDAMITLVERYTGFSIISKLPLGKDAKGVAQTVYRELLPYKIDVLTITTDNGKEFALHKEIAKMLDTKVYFAHPYHSWEKGLIEYTNKLYRQYIPKKARFSDFSQEQIKLIQHKINARPRKKLGYKTPVEVFFRSLHL